MRSYGQWLSLRAVEQPGMALIAYMTGCVCVCVCVCCIYRKCRWKTCRITVTPRWECLTRTLTDVCHARSLACCCPSTNELSPSSSWHAGPPPPPDLLRQHSASHPHSLQSHGRAKQRSRKKFSEIVIKWCSKITCIYCLQWLSGGPLTKCAILFSGSSYNFC